MKYTNGDQVLVYDAAQKLNGVKGEITKVYELVGVRSFEITLENNKTVKAYPQQVRSVIPRVQLKGRA